MSQTRGTAEEVFLHLRVDPRRNQIWRDMMDDLVDHLSRFLAYDIEKQMAIVDRTLMAEKSSNLTGTFKRYLRVVSRRVIASIWLIDQRSFRDSEGPVMGPTLAELEQLRTETKLRQEREEEARKRIRASKYRP